MLFRSWLLGVGALLSLHAQAGEPAPVGIALRENAVLDHTRVTLADVATVQADERTSAAFNAIVLAHAPRIGYTERLTRAQIEMLVRRHADAGNAVLAWTGANAVALHTAAQTVSGDAITAAAIAALRSTYTAPGRRLDVSTASPVADVDVPVGQLSIRPRALDGAALAPRTPVWLDLVVDGSVYRSVVVPLQPALHQNAYVAKRVLEQGAWVGAADFAVVQSNVAGVQAVPVVAALVPFRLARPVKAGQLLDVSAQAPNGKVLRGDQVRVLVKAGQIGIETTATALADAGPGQLLQVRPAGGKDIIAGRLDQSGTVTIE